MKKNYFYIVGILLLLIVGVYFILDYPAKNNNGSEIDKISFANKISIDENFSDSIVRKQEFNPAKNEISFFNNEKLIATFNIDSNNPYKDLAGYGGLHSTSNLSFPIGFKYDLNYIIVSYHASQKNNYDFNLVTTVKIINLKGEEVASIELDNSRFIAKSVSDNLKYIYGIQLTKEDLKNDYQEYRPLLLDVENKNNLLHDYKNLEYFKSTEFTYGVFPEKNHLLLALNNKYVENIKLLNIKKGEVVWSYKANLNKNSIQVNEEVITIVDNANLNIISSKIIKK